MTVIQLARMGARARNKALSGPEREAIARLGAVALNDKLTPQQRSASARRAGFASGRARRRTAQSLHTSAQ